MQGIIVEQDKDNFLRFEFYSNGSDIKIYAANYAGGIPSNINTKTIRSTSNSPVPLYMRVNRAGNNWTQNYSLDGINWNTSISFNRAMTVTSIGPFAGNEALGANPPPAFTGLIDYIFNTKSPIVPEDAIKSSISGFKIDDKNADGSWNAGEIGIPNWKISLVNENTGLEISNTTTDPSGQYVFPNLLGGTYRLTEETKAEYIATNNTSIVISISGIDKKNLNFTNYIPQIAPNITTQPSDKTVKLNQTVTFNVTAVGTNPLSYQWQKNGVDISGANGSSYTTPPTTMLDNGATYRVKVTNSVASTFSNSSKLTVRNIVSDDFNKPSLDTSVWTVINPKNDATFNMANTGTSNASLTIFVPGGSAYLSHDPWVVNNAPRIMQSADNTNFELEVKFLSLMTAQYQSQGLIIQQNNNNYIRFDFVKDSLNTRIFAANITNGIGTVRHDSNIIAGNPLYLKVKRVGDQWTEYYSYEGTNWITAANFNQALIVSSVGPYIGNNGIPESSTPSFIGRIDYFFNTSSPIVPEDDQASRYKISGFKINDLNGNGIWNSGEPGISNWKIYLLNESTNIELTNTITGSNGNYSFENLLNGTYKVMEETKPGYIATGSISKVITILGTDRTNENFTNMELRNKISGFNINDTNDNGVWDSGEQGIPNWKISLFNDTGMEMANITTGINGEYSFENLRIGTYTISEETKSGYTATNSTIKVINLSGQDLTNLNFTNNNIQKAPGITKHPEDQTVKVGKNATFNVIATGTFPLTYQWQKNGTNITGATNSSYTTPPTTIQDNGATFRVIVTNSAGNNTSNSAKLTIISIVSDDFNAPALNTSLWTVFNPKNDAIFSIVGNGTSDALLSISVPSGVIHDPTTGGNTAPRIMQSAGNSDFEVDIKFQSVMTSEYQMQGIIVQQDLKNYLRFDIVKDNTSTKVYATKINNDIISTPLIPAVAISPGNPLFLRVKRVGNQWTENYSYNGINWTTAASFSYVLNVTSIGPFVGNAGTNPPAFTGLIDYFFNTSSIIYPEDTPDTTPPNITIWYGNSQRFGQIGAPQQWVNILGNVADISEIISLNYSLNGGAAQNLTIGPDSMRLESKGDFNVEINRLSLISGSNTIVIKAQDSHGNLKSETVNVEYAGNNVWPINYNLNWNDVAEIQDAAQVVDGLWTKDANGIRPAILGYDRLVDIGDNTWEDYEISVPITINKPMNTSIPLVNVGMILRWNGHYAWDSKQPRNGWHPLGALGLYVWDASAHEFRLGIWGNRFDVIAYDTKGTYLDIGVPYIFKMKAQTIGNNTRYSLKVWEQGTTEPANWTISGLGVSGELKKGSVALMSHYTDASFGNIVVTDIKDITPPVINSIITEVYEDSAIIRWNTDEDASSKVSYGLSTSYENGDKVDGAMVTSHAISLTGLTTGTNYHFKVNSSDMFGNSASSADLNFTTKPPTLPNITTQPKNRTVIEGQAATFNVVASGTAPLTYQWQKDGINIAGATNQSYTTPKANLTDNGTKYRVVVTNNYGFITSDEAKLTVNGDIPWANFHVAVNVSAAGYERYEKPVDVSVNFTQLLNVRGQTGTLDENSIRVVETDGSAGVLNPYVPFQFDKNPDYDASNKATGTIVFIMDGTTQANANRYYRIYFDVTTGGSYSSLPVEPQVRLSDNIQDEGQSSYRIEAAGSTYYLQKQNGGFSSIVDASGLDWIGFHQTGGSTGDYRGIPNVKLGGIFHPGFTCCNVSIVTQGPLKISVRSVSLDGKWESLWDFYPRYATMTMVKAASNYMWLYEGAPGGVFEPNKDFMVKSDGTQTLLSQSWTRDMVNGEWAYFSDPAVGTAGRSFFVSHHEDDTITDTYWPMENNMTVFGFGRIGQSATGYFTSTPQHFSIGLIDGTGYAQNSKIVNSSYKDLTISIESAPVIVMQPVNQNVRLGQYATFTVNAQGKLPLSYQWKKNGNVIPGATGPLYYLQPLDLTDNGSIFTVVVTNSMGSVTSDPALLTVTSQLILLDMNINISKGFTHLDLPYGLPKDFVSPINYSGGTLYQRVEVITKPSQNVALLQSCFFQDQLISEKHACNSGSTFTVPGTYYSSQPMTSMYQYGNISWNRSLLSQMVVLKDKNGIPVDDISYSGLWFGSPDLSLYYPMEVNYTVIVVPPGEPGPTWPPSVTKHPVNQTVVVGDTATFSVEATGAEPLSYQWQKNGVNIPLATSASYNLPAVLADNGSTFSVVVTNPVGSITSKAAVLTVSTVTNNIINNWNFESGTTSWAFYTNGAGTFSVQSPGYEGSNAARLAITNKGTNTQLGQSGLILEPYTRYKLSFAAYSTSGNDLRLGLIKYVSPYSNYGLGTPTFNLGTSWSVFEKEFTTTGFSSTVNNGYLYFSPLAADTYYLDNVRLEKLIPPAIITQPVDQTVDLGQTATFSVAAAGTAPITYQWQKNGTNITGATGATYTTPVTTLADNGATFRVNVMNAQGSVTSNSATLRLSLNIAPGITTQPSSQTVTIGQAATFNVVAYGTAPLAYQWQMNGTDIPGAASATYTTPVTTSEYNGATFRVNISNSFGSVTSIPATLTLALPTAPGIVTQPSDKTVTLGQTATFSVVANGTPTLTYQWQKNGSDIPGATGATYMTPATTLADNGATFRVNVSNAQGSVTSTAATLTLTLPTAPGIVTQPSDKTITLGQTATFSVVANGTEPLTYQWQKNGTNIGGAISASYTTPATTLLDNGSTFSVNVTNSAGYVMSTNAKLTVMPSSSFSLIINGDFESGNTSWAFYTNGVGTFSMESPGYGGSNAAKLVISNKGTNTQIGQSGLMLEPYTRYKLSFAAYSTSGNDIRLGLIKYVSPYSNYGLGTPTFNLGTSWSVFEKEFTTTGFSSTVNNGYLYFSPLAADTYYLDNVRLEKLIPPAIITQPMDQTVDLGQTATFSVAAAGTAPITYQWQKNGTNITGATGATYTTPVTTLADNGATFRVIAMNAQGSVTSNSATLRLSLNIAPGITTQPSSQTVTIGQAATFNVVAYGTAPLAYQWQMNGTDIPGATSATYTTPVTTSEYNGATFRVNISNTFGSVTSIPATLTLTLPTAPGIVTQPSDKTVTLGQTATFSVVANGTPTLTYQWQKNGTIIPGATGATYTTPATTLADNGATFSVNVSNAQGSVTSTAATLTLTLPTAPGIVTQPSDKTITLGQTATFSVVANGTEPLTYQWQKNGTNIEGAISASYTTPATTLLDNGSTFRVNVTNSAGYVTSTNAKLTVMPSTSINLVNNADFESGKTSWAFYGAGSFSMASPGFEGNNAAKLIVSSAGSQLGQSGIKLEPNTRYRLSFAAYSTSGNDIKAFLIKQSSPYPSYGLAYTANLGGSWAPYTTEFTTTGFSSNVSDGYLYFWPLAGATYYLDNVRLEKV